MALEARAVADGEELVVTGDLERRPHADESARVGRQAAVREERQARRARDPDDGVRIEPLARVEPHVIGRHLRHARAAADLDAARARIVLDPPRGAAGIAGEDGRPVLEQGDMAVVDALALEARLKREGQLDAAGARAHHDHARPAAPAQRADQVLRARDQLGNGPRGQRVLAHAGEIEAAHRRAHVERRGVVGQRRAAVEEDAALGGVDAGGPRHDGARAGAAGQRPHVDLQLVAPILTRHEARHHPRIDRDGPIHDHREADARHRRHGPAPEHLHVSMAAADEDEVAKRGGGSAHERSIPARPSLPLASPGRRGYDAA